MMVNTKKTSSLLFGSELKPINIVALEKKTKIPQSTLRLYKRNPDMIPLHRLRIIVNAVGMSEEDIVKLIK